MKPEYCTRPDIPSCKECDLTTYILDCQGNPYVHVGDNISRERIKAGISMDDLAEQTLIPSVLIRQYEDGNKIPSVTHILDIAKGIGISAGELLQ